MEKKPKSLPYSFPPNYVSLATLQQRWNLDQHRRKEVVEGENIPSNETQKLNAEGEEKLMETQDQKRGNGNRRRMNNTKSRGRKEKIAYSSNLVKLETGDTVLPKEDENPCEIIDQKLHEMRFGDTKSKRDRQLHEMKKKDKEILGRNNERKRRNSLLKSDLMWVKKTETL